VAWFETNGIRVGGVGLDCHDLDRQVRFWTAALGYEIKQRGPDFALLRHPAGAGPKLHLQRVADPGVGGNRVHLDLYAVDADRVVDWLSSLGARRLGRRTDDGERWFAMRDPEGNEFNVITAGPDGFSSPFT
jgi:catechol 2,3-dioxygenase-like lactoylglutathione lyase family enzyme